MKTNHPSFLALDRLTGGVHHESTQQHVQACDECLRYVGRLELPTASPKWLYELNPLPGRAPWFSSLTRSARNLRWAGALAAALSVVLIVVVARAPNQAITAKGMPTVRLHVRSGERVFVWGGETLSPGDSVRLEVASGGLQHLVVANVNPAGELQVLHRETLASEGPHLLPISWTLDAAPQDETLVVVLSKRPLPDQSLALEPPSESLLRVRLPLRKKKISP